MDTPTFTSNISFEGEATNPEQAIATLMNAVAGVIGVNTLATVSINVLTNLDIHANTYVPHLLGYAGELPPLNSDEWDLQELLSYIGKPVLVLYELGGDIIALRPWPENHATTAGSDTRQESATVADPLDEANHTDRIDRNGDRWVWCGECDGLRIDGHEAHKSGIGWSAFWIDKVRGPLTFAHRPADTPTAAPQPEQAHGDVDDPARPAERHTDNIRAEAWAEGHRAGFADGVHPDGDHITPNPYRKDQA